MKINLRTSNGHYLVAEQGGNARVLANVDFPGLWETFTLINRDGESDRVETGNRISLQVWNGRFMCAVAGGGREVVADRESPREWETFIISKVGGSGEISHGDAVALRAHNGQYLVAEGGGGGDVLANRDDIREWGTFIVEFWPVKLIYLRAHNGQYVEAEGGGAEILANRNLAGPLETFALINRTGRSDQLRSGDHVSLQARNGQFVMAEGGGGGAVAANRNRAGTWETFTISGFGASGEISDGEAIALRASNGQYLVAEDGGGREVLANRNHVGDWERFSLGFAENAPIPFERVTLKPAGKGRPLDPQPTRQSGTGSILTLLLEYSDMPKPIDDTLTFQHIEEKLYGSGQSVRNWIERNSFGSFTITNAGIHGPIRVPNPFSHYHPQPPDVLWKDVMDAAEAAGVPLGAFDLNANGIIEDHEVLPIIFDFSNIGGAGSHRTVDVTTVGGVRYQGSVIGIGVFLQDGSAQGADQLEGKFYSTLNHELAHAFFGFPDRYGYRAPVRGDVFANRPVVALEWERFVIEKFEGSGEIRDGETVTLRAHSGMYVVAENGGGGVVNANSDSAQHWETFVIKRMTGEGRIGHGDSIALAAHNGQFVVAERGGGAEVLANRDHAGEWETFTITNVNAQPDVLSGNEINLRAHNGQYVVAETDGRTTDPEAIARGYEWKGNCGTGVGGGFDIMDDNCRSIMMGAYDRIKSGWLRPRFLTPDNRGCYGLRPSIDFNESLVLWDPQFPREWYVVENRQERAGTDEVPGSGLAITWVCEDREYWEPWLPSEMDLMLGRFPALISAVAPDVPPNPMATPATFDPIGDFKRQDADSLFRSGSYVLPRGVGIASRFHISFHSGSNGALTFCLH